MADKSHPKPPASKPADPTPTPEYTDTAPLVPPPTNPCPPGEESPHDFIRRRMTELRKSEAKPDDD